MAKRRQYGNIRKLASGRWQARYWRLGTQICAPRTFTTKADASAWLSGIETDLLRGDFVPLRDKRMTFGRYSRAWLDQRASLRPHTQETYESQLSHALRPNAHGGESTRDNKRIRPRPTSRAAFVGPPELSRMVRWP